jgi:RNA polymerase sigma-70 factor (ECF subfamily)
MMSIPQWRRGIHAVGPEEIGEAGEPRHPSAASPTLGVPRAGEERFDRDSGQRRGPGPGGREADSGGGRAPGAAEVALLRAGLAGDDAALDRLLALHERALFALCHGILGHTEDAEDAVQETFLRALRAFTSFRGDAAFRTWLFRIAVNLCLQWKASHHRTEPWDEERSSNRAEGASPEAVALRQLRIREALSNLQPRHRALLLLKEREGWSVAEIAAALGWSERQVRYELSKARRSLVEWRRRDAARGEEP